MTLQLDDLIHAGQQVVPEPAPGAEARMWEGIAHRLGPGGGPAPATSTGGASLIAKLAVASALAAGVVGVVVSGSSDEPQPAPAAVQAPAPIAAVAVTADVADEPAAPQVAADEEAPTAKAEPLPAPEADMEKPAPADPEVPTAKKARPRKAPSADDLAAESELMRAAQRQLKAGDHSAALRTVAEHRRRFPRGALATSREAVHAVALCLSGAKPKGQKRARRFLKSHGGTPFAARVLSACEL